DLFFGRDDEGHAVLDKLRSAGRVLLVGPSGCGKSSLVRARVLPALTQGPDRKALAVIRPGARPDAALRTALEGLDPRLRPASDACLRGDDEPAGFAALAGHVPAADRLVYIDQLEEVFLDDAAGSRSERMQFFARLAALDHLPGMAVVLSMRADFYADL